MSEVNLSVGQEELVRKAALNRGFEDFEVVVDVGSLKGDNYMGVIRTVTVIEKPQKKSLHLILKSAPSNETFRTKVNIAKIFEREALLYSSIIPELVKFQDEKVVSHPFTGVANFCGYSLEDKSETILMEDLKKNGYALWDRMKPMDDEHITEVFNEYARLHAASLAYKKLHPNQFDELTKNIKKSVFDTDDLPNKEQVWAGIIKIYFTNGFQAVRNNPKATEALKKMRDNVKPLFETLETDGQDRFVVTHGDCWCNNMLFKYEDHKKQPTKVCFIDWQLAKLASPVLDLAYFFSVCASKEVFPNLDKYLSGYHQVLSQNLREFGCDPEEVFSFQVLMNEWQSKSWYGVFLAMMIVKLMLSDSEEAPNLNDTITEDTDIFNSMTEFKMARTEEVEERLCDLIDFMANKNYI